MKADVRLPRVSVRGTLEVLSHCSDVGEDKPNERESVVNTSTGVLIVHSVARAVVSHIEWAVNAALGSTVRFRWHNQVARDGFVRTQVYWEGPVGAGASLASMLVGWSEIRFEIIEDARATTPGVHILHTPTLGLHTNQIDAAGNFTVTEHVLNSVITEHAGDADGLVRAIEIALGKPWDIELEPYRRGEAVGELSWLTQVG